jgi:twinfilin-like protein
VSSPNQRGLLCTIDKEALTPLTVLEPATSSFDNDLSLLQPHIQPNVALYIILRRYPASENAPFVAVTYVPDPAPVRQKMLFASTRLTLVRELGTERFREQIFVTTKEELTKEGFEKHDKHVGLDAPLTEEEQTLGEVKRKEAEEGRGTNGRRAHVSSGVSMPVSEEALEALKGLAEDKDNLVQLVCSRLNETEAFLLTVILL